MSLEFEIRSFSLLMLPTFVKYVDIFGTFFSSSASASFFSACLFLFSKLATFRFILKKEYIRLIGYVQRFSSRSDDLILLLPLSFISIGMFSVAIFTQALSAENASNLWPNFQASVLPYGLKIG